MSLNVSAVVITYEPNIEHIGNLKIMSSLFDKLYIVDNSTLCSNVLDSLANKNGIEIIRLKQNMGIAKALNIGLKKALADGFDVSFTFDQDSTLDFDFEQKMRSYLEEIIGIDSKVFIVAPNFYDRNSKSYAMTSLLSKWSCKNIRLDPHENGYFRTSFAITSGSAIFLNNFLKVGDYKEEYFIDHVDSEICLRAQLKGFNTYVVPSVVLSHSIGARTKHIFLGVTIKANHHNPQRRYFIIRNGIAMTKSYFWKCPSHVYLALGRLIHELLAVILYEKQKVRKLRAIFTGIVHGLMGNFDNKFRF